MRITLLLIFTCIHHQTDKKLLLLNIHLLFISLSRQDRKTLRQLNVVQQRESAYCNLDLIQAKLQVSAEVSNIIGLVFFFTNYRILKCVHFNENFNFLKASLL